MKTDLNFSTFISLRSPNGGTPQGCQNSASVLDALLQKYDLKNDAALARMLQVAPPVLSKIRHQKARLTPALMIRIHEVTHLSIQEIRSLMDIQG